MIFGSSAVVILTTIVCIIEQEMEFFEFLGVLFFPLFFIMFGVIGITSATKRVEVHKGKIIYHNGVKNIEYRMSDIKTFKKQSETFQVGYLEDIIPVESSDITTTFYDKTGKKVFKFGLSYDNLERLTTDIKNTQKSISRQQSR